MMWLHNLAHGNGFARQYDPTMRVHLVAAVAAVMSVASAGLLRTEFDQFHLQAGLRGVARNCCTR
jgi:hypothetical protein